MKKVVAAFTVLVLVSGVSFPVEASIFGNLKQKVTDKVKGRQNDDVSRKLNETASTLTSLGSNLKSSGTSQEKYVDSQYLLAEEDLSFLSAYSVFAKISGDFFSKLGSTTKKLRTEYSSLLGAQNKSNQANMEENISSQANIESKIESTTASIQKILETLISDGFSAHHTTVHCLAIMLLKIMQKHPLPEANRTAVQNQIKAIYQKYSPFLSLLSEDIANNMNEIKEKIGLEQENFESLMEPLVQTITIIYHTINILRRYVNVSHDDKLLEEITETLDKSPYYKPVENDDNDDATLYDEDYDSEYDTYADSAYYNYNDDATLYGEDEEADY